jgi:Fe-S-cluster containining protein
MPSAPGHDEDRAAAGIPPGPGKPAGGKPTGPRPARRKPSPEATPAAIDRAGGVSADGDAAEEPDVLYLGVNLTRDFRCAGCGNCCRGPGRVWVDRRGAVEIADHLGLLMSEFRERFVALDWNGGHVLRDKSEEDDACVFLTPDNRCAIHPVKPKQCADFPYKWRNHDFAETCEGFLALKRKADAGRE